MDPIKAQFQCTSIDELSFENLLDVSLNLNFGVFVGEWPHGESEELNRSSECFCILIQVCTLKRFSEHSTTITIVVVPGARSAHTMAVFYGTSEGDSIDGVIAVVVAAAAADGEWRLANNLKSSDTGESNPQHRR